LETAATLAKERSRLNSSQVNSKSEDKSTGYIPLHRKIREHWIWSDPVKFRWWVDILFSVNHTSKTVNVGNKLIECNRGQSIKSIGTWAREWRVDESKVRRFFKLLQDDGMIVTENVVKTTRLTVCNYDNYNAQRRDNDEIMTPTRRDRDEIVNPNNNENNDDNEKREADLPTNKKKKKNIKILFRESPFFEKLKLADALKGTPYEKADIDYYHESLTNWSDANGSRKIDWLATIKIWMTNDLSNGKFKTKSSINGNNTSRKVFTERRTVSELESNKA
jgi:hypothetical protein